MKKYTHAWLAMMAMKRLDMGNLPETEGSGKHPKEVQRYARTLVRWFKNYRDFVVQGAWYPDEVLCDQGSSHGAKYTLGDPHLPAPVFKKLPKTMEIYKLMKKQSALYEEPFTIVGGNVCDRVNAMCHTIVDNFKIQFREEKGNPIGPTSTHMAMRFFILSHYIADSHMPLHCDARKLDKVHAAIEKIWEDEVNKSYEIDKDNDRFFYDPKGYPLATEKMTDLVKAVEEKIISRPFIYNWGDSKYSAWDYISAVTENSYMLAYEMIPKDSKDMSIKDYKLSPAFEHFYDYSSMLLADAVDSIARAWLHVWVRYREWGPDKNKVSDNYTK